MPKKINSHGNMQNYVPVGNGDASDEYGDNESGSNKHFKTFYKSQVQGEVTGKNGEESLKMKSSASKSDKDLIKKYKLGEESYDKLKEKFDTITNEDVKNELLEALEDAKFEKEIDEILEIEDLSWIDDEEFNEIIEEKQDLPDTYKETFEKADVKAINKAVEDKIEAFDKEDIVGYLLAGNDLEAEKLAKLTDDELKTLAIAKANIEKEKNYEKIDKKVAKFIKENNNIDLTDKNGEVHNSNIWVKTPKSYDEALKSLDSKIEYFKEQIAYNGGKSGEWVAEFIDVTNQKIEKLTEFKQNLIDTYTSEFAKVDKFNEKLASSKELLENFVDKNNVYSAKAKSEAHWFKSMSESQKYFKDIQETYDKIGKDDLNKVIDYTGSYSSINEPLRKTKYYGNASMKAKFLNQVKGMTNAINKSPLKENMWFQRGVSKLNINGNNLDYWGDIDNLVGKTFEDQGFVSCGTHKGSGFSSHDIIMNIYAPKGTKALYVAPISHYGSEDETIIQRGYSYKITKAEKSNGKIYLDCEVILGSDEKKYNDTELAELKEKYF